MVGKSFMIICAIFKGCPSFLFPPKVSPTPSHPLYPRMRINLALFKPAHQSSVLTNKGKSTYLSPFLCFLFSLTSLHVSFASEAEGQTGGQVSKSNIISLILFYRIFLDIFKISSTKKKYNLLKNGW